MPNSFPMKRLLMIAIVAGFVAPCLSADLAKTNRTIGKQPTYKSKPRYCLVVFGPMATTKVWLVLDGSTLYVDRDGDNDLTGQHEQFTLDDGFQPIEIEEVDRRATHQIVRVQTWTEPDGARGMMVGVKANEKYRQFANCYPTERPQKAPIVHFDGPRTIRLLEEPELVPGQPVDLQVVIGTPGVGRDAFAYLDVETDSLLPKNEHPVAKLLFSPKTQGERSVQVEVGLPFRC